MTIANYEYALYWILDTAGAIHYEVRATGIMSVVPMQPDVDHDINYGIMVAPGVMAPSHQHIFSLRIDPAIDAYRGSVIRYEETLPMPLSSRENPFGVAFQVNETNVTRPGHLDLDVSSNRTVKIVNAQLRNPVTGKSPGYKVIVPATQLQLAHPSSVHHARGEFADHHFYFTTQNESELYPASDYPWQSTGGYGVRKWAQRDENLADKGIVWCNFGFTHNPRPEDWPVMPCEVFRMHLKPSHFFTQNPALDIPQSTQKFNKSVLVPAEVSECCSSRGSML